MYLRRHVARRPHWTLDRLRHDLRDPEVADTNAPITTDEHVRGLEVPVDELARVCSRQPLPRLPKHLHDLLPGALLREPSREVDALDQLHRDEHPGIERPDVVHGDHVRMGQPCHRLALAERSSRQGLLALRPPAPDDLDRDRAIELRIVRLVHRAAATASEGTDDQVAVDEVPAPQLGLRRGIRIVAQTRLPVHGGLVEVGRDHRFERHCSGRLF